MNRRISATEPGQHRTPAPRSLAWAKLAIAAASVGAIPFLAGANGGGCGADVVVGNDAPCVVTGCSGQICADAEVASTCEWSPKYACYQQFGTCGRAADGQCGWEQSDALTACLNAPDDTCNVDADCPATEACLACGDGSCATTACVGGQCQASCPPNPGQCGSTADCIFDTVCQVCPDGSCAQGTCVNGQCGLVCGGGTDPGSCASANDCVFPEICKLCADGTCAQGDCVNGACELVCPSDPTQCQADGDCASTTECVSCGDGTCATTTCVNGACELSCPSQPPTCAANSDCIFPAVCVGCDDGSCAQGECVNGACELVCPG